MDRSFLPIDWKPQATAGSRWKAMLSRAPMHRIAPDLVGTLSFNRCLTSAAENSGLDDFEIADKLHISHGYMSKFMRFVAQQWARRLVAYMEHTRSLAPLQWMAAQVGCELVERSSVETDLALAKATIAKYERDNRVLS